MKMRIRWFLTVCILFLILCTAGQNVSAQDTQVEVTNYNVVIPGLKQEYSFLILNDQHIILSDDSVKKEKEQELVDRIALFTNSSGSTSAQSWPGMITAVNEQHPDGVLFLGDMLDFYSEENFALFCDEAKNLEAPLMYLRADHDYGIWYHDHIEKEQRDAAEKDFDGNDRVFSMEYEDFMLVGINNNTSQITKRGLKLLKKIWKKEKPVILFLHVPLKSQTDDSLAEASKEVWQDRALLWGENCYYEPNERTQTFLDMVTAEDSPVKAVFAAHLHFPFEDEVREGIPQYVLDASYKGKMAHLTVKGE